MAKVKVLDNMVVIKSDVLTDAALENALLLNESALKLRNDEGDVRYEVTKANENTFTKFGAAFLNGESKGIITIPSDKDEEGRKAYVKAYITPIVVAIMKIEEAIEALDNNDVDLDIDFV